MKREIEPLRINPGVYRLSRDVANPKADRRSPNYWRNMVTWRAGLEFVVVGDSEIPYTDDEIQDLPPEARNALANARKRNHNQEIKSVLWNRERAVRAYADTERWNALVGALEPAPQSWEAFWTLTDEYSILTDDFVRWLVSRGYFSREKLAQEFKAWENDNTDDAAWRRAGPTNDAFHYEVNRGECACGNLWPCTRMTGPGGK